MTERKPRTRKAVEPDTRDTQLEDIKRALDTLIEQYGKLAPMVERLWQKVM